MKEGAFYTGLIGILLIALMMLAIFKIQEHITQHKAKLQAR